MQKRPDAERVNARAKLIMDRVIARRIARDPAIVDRARKALADPADGSASWWVAEWSDILAMSHAEVCRFLRSRSEHARRMTDCSPFYSNEVVGFDLSNAAFRKRVWRKAFNGSREAMGS